MAGEQDEKTVRVRVAVAVGEDGSWAAEGGSAWPDKRSAGEAAWHVGSVKRIYFIEATLPLPAASTVEAEVRS